MSADPPYISARYAAANDLSVVLGDTLRHTQFLPFIRYNFICAASQKSLDVQGGKFVRTLLWQYDVNNTIAQFFSFEDAGEGYFYIRTHCGNLYVTVNVPEPVIVKNKPLPPPPETSTHTIKQDVKYKPSETDMYHQPGHQKWMLAPVLQSGQPVKDTFTITNAFFAKKVLQAVNTQSQGSVILGDNTGHNLNAWKITIRPIDS